MKTMKKQMMTLAAVLMAGAAVTSCSSDNEMDSLKAPAAKTYTMTVEATKGDGGTRALADGGTTLTSTWTAGDEVEVWSEDGTTTKYGELTAATAGASTTLTGTLTTLPENGATLTLKYLSANYSTQDGTLTGSATSIDRVCDYATATVTATVDGDNVTTTAAAFENQQAVVKFTLKNKANDSDLSATKLFVTANGTTYTVTPSSAASVLYVAVPAISAKQVTLTAQVGSTYYDFANTSATFVNGKFYRVTVKMTNGTLSGKFTINSSGDKVYFSKGNLQYDGTNWKFATNQWDVLGANGTKANGTATGYPMDLFTWGNIDNPAFDGTDYYTENANLSGTYDWGSRMGSGWYTLSKDEWLYLFGMESNNTDKSGHARYRKYFRATVNGVSGIVVLPDDISGISDIPAESSRGTESAFNVKTYTTAAWSALESSGCVFLPAAGFRNGTSVNNVGSSGFYWSSTANGTDDAYSVGFDLGNVFPANYFNRTLWFSVRLVRDVAAPAPANKLLSAATTSDIGKIVGADGKIYDTKAAAEAVATGNAVAMIAYVGSSTEHATYTHGLAIALADESGTMNWSTAKSTCEGKSAVTNAAWLLPSKNQWNAMFNANGGNEESYTGLNNALATAGGDSSKLQNGGYWTSSEGAENYYWHVRLFPGGNTSWGSDFNYEAKRVRACLAF